ncbi:MAG: O-antigen ligase family protein [Bacteriovoracia bacterium]
MIFNSEHFQRVRIPLYLTISVLIVSIFGVLNFYGYSVVLEKFPTAFNRGIIKSTIGNTNYVANFLACALPLLILGFFTDKGKVKSTLFWISGTLSAVVILWCQTRSVYFGLTLSLLIFLFIFTRIRKKGSVQFKRKKTLFLILSFIIAFAFFVYPPGLPEDIPSPFETAFLRTAEVIDGEYAAGSPYKRELEWKTSLEMFKDKPLLGHGWGSFKLLSADYQMRITNSESKFYGYYQKDYESHSDWLQLLAEGGIVLFGIFALLVIWIAFNGIKKILKGDLFMTAVFCGWLVIIAHSFLEFPFHMQPSLAMFAIFSAILLDGVKVIHLKAYWKYVFLLLMVPVLYVGGRAYLADIFTIRSKLKAAQVELYLKGYENINVLSSQIEEIGQTSDSLDSTKIQISTSILKDTMDLIFLSKYGLQMNPDDSFLNGYLSAGISYLRFLPEGNQKFILSYYAPFPKYEGSTDYAIQFRNPPTSSLSLPVDSQNKDLFEILKLYSEVRMNIVNMPLDPNAMRGIGNITSNAIILMQSERKNREGSQMKENEYKQILEPWYEWMKYGYQLALKMRGRDSEDWDCVDLEFLTALLETEGPEGDFQEEFITRLEHRQKLIEYEIDTDLPEKWYDFIEKNMNLLEPEYHQQAEEILSEL